MQDPVSRSENGKHDFEWIFDVLDELGPVPLPCLYYNPEKMFNIRGVTQPKKHQLDEFLKEQISKGRLQLSDTDGIKVVDFTLVIDRASYIPPSERKHSHRIERVKGHEESTARKGKE